MPINAKAIQAFLDYKPRALPDVKSMNPEELDSFIRRATGMPPKLLTAPRLPQLQGLALALHAERFLAFYGMRMGKTKLALDWAQHLAMCGDWNEGKGLVIVPAPILMDVWEGEAARHSVLSTRTVGPRVEDMLDALESDADLIIASWSSLQAMFTVKRRNRKKRMQLYPDEELLHLFSQSFRLAIVDEIHEASNPSSLRFKIGRMALAFCTYRLGLTGTPWGRDPFKVWAQAALIDDGDALGHNYYFFEAAFGAKGINYATGNTEYKFDKKKMPILQDKLASISLSYRWSEEGKGVYPGTVDLHMRGDQATAYQNAIKKYIAEATGERHALTAVFVRLRQIASGFVPFVDEVGNERTMVFASNAKLEWLRDFFAQIGPDVRFVLFHEFTRTGEMLCQALTEAKISHAWLYGGTKDKPGALRSFQEGKAQVIVCNAASGGRGVDLSIADYQIFVESPTSPITREQAEKRAQGEARQGRPLMIDDMLCAPVEHRVLGFIKEGKDCLDELFKDPKLFAQDATLTVDVPHKRS